MPRRPDGRLDMKLVEMILHYFYLSFSSVIFFVMLVLIFNFDPLHLIPGLIFKQPSLIIQAIWFLIRYACFFVPVYFQYLVLAGIAVCLIIQWSAAADFFCFLKSWVSYNRKQCRKHKQYVFNQKTVFRKKNVPSLQDLVSLYSVELWA